MTTNTQHAATTPNQAELEQFFGSATLKRALMKARCMMGVITPLEEAIAGCAKDFPQQPQGPEQFGEVKIADGYFATLNWEERMLRVTGMGSLGLLKFEYPVDMGV